VIQKTGKEMVLIEAGWFEMGSTKEQMDAAYQLGKKYNKDTKRAWFKSEKPQHRVWVDAYYIDKTEVTNREYRQFMEASGYERKEYWSAEGWKFIQQKKITEPRYWSNPEFNQPNQPVIGISWYEAEAYASWAGKKLPTEAQWEKAARGNDKRKYAWGNEAADGSRANYCDAKCVYNWKDKSANDGHNYTSPVGSYEAGKSPDGIYDLTGNVWEWVRDWYDADYYSQSPERNPVNDKKSTHRVLRGGGWGNILALVRSAYRNRASPITRSGDVGFRCVALENKLAWNKY
jgi:formylglycine-generating enzyme required for sulfatase activity